MADLVEVIKNLGLSTKAAKIYLAALELGEATVQELARKSRLKRTTLYYILDELTVAGVLISTIAGKKVLYTPTEPVMLLKRAKEKISNFEESLGLLEEKVGYVKNKPKIHLFYGVAGFKQAWDIILNTKEKEYRIITDGKGFLDYVKERYIVDGIITKKKISGVLSKQLIVDSEYGRQIVTKDARENRISKFLPAVYKLPFTEVITESVVVFISPRFNNMIFAVEDECFSKTRRAIFESLWQLIA